MCLRLRNTASRGRSAVPAILLRSRSCRTTRSSCLVVVAISRNPLLLRCGALAGLQLDRFALITDSFALIRLRLAYLANVGGDLAYEGLIDATDFNALRSRPLFSRDFKRYAVYRVHIHRVRIAHIERQPPALGLDTISDADYFQRLGMTRGH